MTDPYFKLKPNEPTPAEECCSCSPLTAVYLAHKLADNPIYCMTCRGEVAPERISFDDATTEIVARWHDVYRSVYALWLASGSYETWAASELRSRGSEVNQLGLKARGALSRYLPTSYLWFWEEDRPTACPNCQSTKLVGDHLPLRCENCSVCV
jgi:hypothetical protein